METHNFPIFALIMGLIFLSPARSSADDRISLDAYLDSIDRVAVSLDGYIYREAFDGTQFYNKSNHSFKAILDAGRDIRENIEENCSIKESIWISNPNCRIKATGLILLNGSDIEISIEDVQYLSSAADRDQQPNEENNENVERQEQAMNSLISSLAQGGAQQSPSSKGSSSGNGAIGGLSITDVSKIVRAVGRHWNVPCGQRGINDMVVEIRLMMQQNGHASRWEILDSGRYYSDPTYRSVADSAVRAIQQAQPLPFPPNDYNLWRSVKLSFPVRDVCEPTSFPPPP